MSDIDRPGSGCRKYFLWLFLSVLLLILGQCAFTYVGRQFINHVGDPLSAGPVDSVTIRRFSGCYTMTVGRWYPSGMAGHNDHKFLPKRIKLDTTFGTKSFEQGKRLIRPSQWIIPGRMRQHSLWIPTGRNAATLVWTSGFAGVHMDVKLDSTGWSGRAEAFSDVRGFTPSPIASVRGQRIPCDSVSKLHGNGHLRRSGRLYAQNIFRLYD